MIVIKWVKDITESRISKEHGRFRKGKVCVDQIFSLGWYMVEKCYERKECLCCIHGS